MDWTILYDGWTGPARVAVSAVATYVGLVLLLLRDVQAVVLETNGNFSVIGAPPGKGGMALLSARRPGVAASPEP